MLDTVRHAGNFTVLITGSQDHWITGSQDHRITGSQDHRITGSQEGRTPNKTNISVLTVSHLM